MAKVSIMACVHNDLVFFEEATSESVVVKGQVTLKRRSFNGFVTLTNT